MTAAASCPGPHARYGLCYHKPPHTDLDRMLAALDYAVQQGHLTILPSGMVDDEQRRINVAQALLNGVGLGAE